MELQQKAFVPPKDVLESGGETPLKQTELLKTAYLSPEDPTTVLHYFLIREPKDGEGYQPYIGYGVQIHLCSHGRISEMGAASNITCSYQKAVSLIELLARNTVTPVTLDDVIEDYLGAVEPASDEQDVFRMKQILEKMAAIS
jgi:hypothetical protein